MTRSLPDLPRVMGEGVGAQLQGTGVMVSKVLYIVYINYDDAID
jgi:hypothetical protein